MADADAGCETRARKQRTTARGNAKRFILLLITATPLQSSTSEHEFRRILFIWTSAAWTVKGGNLLADDRIIRSFVYVDLRPMSIVFRHVGVGEDRFYRAFRHARITIDTGISVDVKTIRQFMKCFYRTNSCAVGLLAIDA